MEGKKRPELILLPYSSCGLWHDSRITVFSIWWLFKIQEAPIILFISSFPFTSIMHAYLSFTETKINEFKSDIFWLLQTYKVGLGTVNDLWSSFTFRTFEFLASYKNLGADCFKLSKHCETLILKGNKMLTEFDLADWQRCTLHLPSGEGNHQVVRIFFKKGIKPIIILRRLKMQKLKRIS